MAKSKIAVLVLLVSAISFSAQAAATIRIINNNVPGIGLNDPTPVPAAARPFGNNGATVGEQRQIALNYAASLWGMALDSTVEIRILAAFVNQTCTPTGATLASAGTLGAWSGFPGKPANMLHHEALADKLAGQDLDPTFFDLQANFNRAINGNPACLGGNTWYYGLDGNEGANQIDLVAVALHEFGHGLGFASFVDKSPTLANGQPNPNLGSLLGQTATSPGFPDVYTANLKDMSSGKDWLSMTRAERAASLANPAQVVWTGAAVSASAPAVLGGSPTLSISAPVGIAGNYAVGTASWGARLKFPGASGPVVQAVDAADAAGPSTTDGCSAFLNSAAIAGKVALVDRGTCGFTVKAKNAQIAGAIAVIVADNVVRPLPGMGGADSTVTIPAVMITLASGNLIKSNLASGVVASVGVNPSVRAGVHPSSQQVLVYTPAAIAAGSSVSHWDTSAYPNLLMEPSNTADTTHRLVAPDDLTLVQMRDIGWYPDANGDLVDDQTSFTEIAAAFINRAQQDMSDSIAQNPGTPTADKVEDILAKANAGERKFVAKDWEGAAGEFEGAAGDLQAAHQSRFVSDQLGRQTGSDLTAVNRLMAVQEINRAVARNASASKVDEARRLLAEGDAKLAASQYKDAAAKFKDAISKARGA